MNCARNLPNSIQKQRERSTSKTAVVWCAYWRFVCSQVNRFLLNACQPALRTAKRLQGFLLFATERNFTNESISEWKRCSERAFLTKYALSDPSAGPRRR